MTAVAPFPVLFVCVGNVCRSPFAERLLRLRLEEHGVADLFEVTSAGVMGMAGRAMHAQSALDLAARGGSADGFVARQFYEGIGERAGLILTATKEIRSRVLVEVPSALRRTFTVLEFASLARTAPPGLELTALVRNCGDRRSAATLPDYDVADPIGGQVEDFERAAVILDGAVTSIARSITAAASPTDVESSPITSTVAPDLAALLQMLEASESPPIYECTPAEARAAMRVLMVQMRAPEFLVGGVTVSDDTVAGHPARVYRPDPVAGSATGPLPTVAFLHGGGFVIGDLDTHDPLCRMIARDCEAVVVAIDYPMAPEHPFPEPVEAALAAVREVHARRGELGGDDRVAVAGDSAGGNLSAVVAQQARDLGLTAQLLIYPVVDPAGEYASRKENGTGYFLDVPTMDWFFLQYVGAKPGDSVLSDLQLAPLRGDLAGLAPAVVATAEFDPLRDEGEAYAAALHTAGVQVDAIRYDGQIHGFANMDHLARSAKAATDDMLARFKALLHP